MAIIGPYRYGGDDHEIYGGDLVIDRTGVVNGGSGILIQGRMT